MVILLVGSLKVSGTPLVGKLSDFSNCFVPLQTPVDLRSPVDRFAFPLSCAICTCSECLHSARCEECGCPLWAGSGQLSGWGGRSLCPLLSSSITAQRMVAAWHIHLTFLMTPKYAASVQLGRKGLGLPRPALKLVGNGRRGGHQRQPTQKCRRGVCWLLGVDSG